MAKLVIEVDKIPQKNDVLLYNGVKWVCTSKDSIVQDLKKEISVLKKDCESIKEEQETFKKAVNQKLKDHHDVLRELTKGE